jgi:V/A-type H+/Na+-transporting ATPase subunit D
VSAMSTQDITPTRSVLIELKRKIKLSQSGYKIMKMKRDGLIIEFFEVMEKARKMREGVTSDYESAMEKIAIARAVEGEIAVKSAAYALKADPQVTVGSKSIMGMMVPKVEATSVHTKIVDKGYGVISTSAYIEEAAVAFEKLLDTLIRAAEIETTMKKLLDEIEKTKRRVNALEFKVIPELQESQRFVKFRLEEMERENTTRLKHLKKKGEALE